MGAAHMDYIISLLIHSCPTEINGKSFEEKETRVKLDNGCNLIILIFVNN